MASLSILFQFRLPEDTVPSFLWLQQTFGFIPNDFDQDFGIIPTDDEARLYVVLVQAESQKRVANFLQKHQQEMDSSTGFFSNPSIDTFE